MAGDGYMDPDASVDAVHGFMDDVASGRNPNAAWERLCLLFGRHTTPWLDVRFEDRGALVHGVVRNLTDDERDGLTKFYKECETGDNAVGDAPIPNAAALRGLRKLLTRFEALVV